MLQLLSQSSSTELWLSTTRLFPTPVILKKNFRADSTDSTHSLSLQQEIHNAWKRFLVETVLSGSNFQCSLLFFSTCPPQAAEPQSNHFAFRRRFQRLVESYSSVSSIIASWWMITMYTLFWGRSLHFHNEIEPKTFKPRAQPASCSGHDRAEVFSACEWQYQV